VRGALYFFQPDALLIRLVKILPQTIQSFNGPSYLSRGILYYSGEEGEALELKIGSVT
jgi:hypothetical protein